MPRFALTAAILASIVLPSAAAHALPKYAAKEKKTCVYCHTGPTGGALNDRGKYYAAHDHSFAGYQEGATTTGGTPAAPGAPILKEAWRMQMPDDTQRIAVAAVTADKKPRILALSKAGTLTVFKPKPTELQKEATVDLGANANKVVVGEYAKGSPAVVVVPGAAYYIKGDSFTRVPLPDVTDITGTVRFTDGTEEFFYFTGQGQPDVYTLNLTADKPLVAGRDLVMPDQGAGVYAELVGHLTPDQMTQFGMPAAAQKPGVLGGFDPLGNGHFYGFAPWNDNGKWYVVLIDPSAMSPLSGVTDVKPVWRSEPLQGNVMDIAIGADPFTGKTRGLYVLTSIGVENRQRMVQYITAGKVEKPE